MLTGERPEKYNALWGVFTSLERIIELFLFF